MDSIALYIVLFLLIAFTVMALVRAVRIVPQATAVTSWSASAGTRARSTPACTS